MLSGHTGHSFIVLKLFYPAAKDTTSRKSYYNWLTEILGLLVQISGRTKVASVDSGAIKITRKTIRSFTTTFRLVL